MEPTSTGEDHAFYEELGRRHVVALWNVAASLLPREPKVRVIPYLWRWSDLQPLLERSGELVPLKRGAERRVLGFIDPGLPERFGATHTLRGAYQGEDAILFSVHDTPVMQALGFYREQAYADHGGQQPVARLFAG